MWFKNLQLHRLPAPWAVTPDQMEEWLAPHAFQPCSSVEMQRAGWASPRDDGALVYSINRQMLLMFRAEKKLLPASVVNQVTKARALEIEEQQGFKVGRKQMRELKEQVTDELLPRAFTIRRDTRVWIDTVNGWLVIDAAAQALADDVRSLLVKSIDQLPLAGIQVALSPVAAMTAWLLSGEVPGGFTVDQDAELRSSGEGGATVRYVGHALETKDMRGHIEAGKQCTRLAMTWDDRISFVLTPSLTIKRVTPLDVIKEAADPTAQNDDERFDSDITLMTGELGRMLSDLVAILGGERQDSIREAAAA
ncbi:recombination-associated protein RdgC [Burkholderia pseudomultivorans]|uniref:Recombination-associated protein RdgC n=1 Tax=Burkholderia pseudomultivorans TaxID=1207504 RepID=A0ABU2E046_9BURK|nr:recombination-associated protein RdgC [Burkholderia pseudomultivorans]MDR8726759.1 Recombination-associated protein RdgC [Burkholderia pseudomultivorans]MDR8736136.1 Recombination-associated protein RdgC [Burkholderia pseudomultivorans]MDR8742112.1 Recombination-associated protein RdgC [Burkholderia pseudomultivorans]MDR8753089.1 Recombination-associated protein RdgC [Burkholderia pseudomultivorans]MDR8778706.1 Recombination-associated protein RdgC [Burkholderia pseudomultivorans]